MLKAEKMSVEQNEFVKNYISYGKSIAVKSKQ